ncbi:hypothetical protein BP00DRAFT_416733 [Aspergillus indologenus CBS 114.80]|uniref:Zn(2)-C6 fungal-type domain-containing protein n=1 Tax=Aspergillus indologenus CBS 114.80 TaxID=1450541 RepID=A0A2V5I7A0_9EURO|nr:hypothetical protein BP00DRAFT_416733 [Aspergillus indologenus CBS 114.80]
MSLRTLSSRPRACDRCWLLKTQCDSRSPCARCQRLELPCVTERPLQAKGRPKKSASIRRAFRQSPAEPTGPGSGGQEVIASPSTADVSPAAAATGPSPELSELSLDPDLVDGLLHQITSSSRKLGIFGALPASFHLAGENHGNGSLRQVWNSDQWHVLLALSLEIYHLRVPDTAPGPRELSQDWLRRSVLALTQDISGKAPESGIENVLLLLLSSYTWCLSVEFVAIAARWQSLSCVIYHDIAKLPAPNGDGCELKNRKPSCDLQKQVKSQIADVQPALYHAIITVADWEHLSCMRAVIEAPSVGSRAWLMAKNELSDYFFGFPPTLLRFDDLSYVYEAEAMIWMHGLFIILRLDIPSHQPDGPTANIYLDGTRDLINLTMDPMYLEAERFSHLLEHSILLGDVIPTVLSLDPSLDCLSPATVFFILHSATVHAMALRQFIPNHCSRASLGTGAPAKLARSSGHHCDLLSAVQLHCKRYDVPIIGEVHSLLSYYRSQAAFRASAVSAIRPRTLMHYRWCQGGAGIVPLRTEDAEATWHYTFSPDEDLWQTESANRSVLQAVIADLCAPEARICRNGYFDLSILLE